MWRIHLRRPESMHDTARLWREGLNDWQARPSTLPSKVHRRAFWAWLLLPDGYRTLHIVFVLIIRIIRLLLRRFKLVLQHSERVLRAFPWNKRLIHLLCCGEIPRRAFLSVIWALCVVVVISLIVEQEHSILEILLIELFTWKKSFAVEQEILCPLGRILFLNCGLFYSSIMRSEQTSPRIFLLR